MKINKSNTITVIIMCISLAVSNTAFGMARFLKNITAAEAGTAFICSGLSLYGFNSMQNNLENQKLEKELAQKAKKQKEHVRKQATLQAEYDLHRILRGIAQSTKEESMAALEQLTPGLIQHCLDLGVDMNEKKSKIGFYVVHHSRDRPDMRDLMHRIDASPKEVLQSTDNLHREHDTESSPDEARCSTMTVCEDVPYSLHCKIKQTACTKGMAEVLVLIEKNENKEGKLQ